MSQQLNLKDVDPAIVSMEKPAAKQHPPPAVKKPDLPVCAKIATPASVTGEGDAAEAHYEINWATHCLVATIDSKMVTIPRAVAAKMPVVGPILADQAADDHSPIPIGTNAGATIAIAQWVEHTGSAAGRGETAMPNVVLYTEMPNFVTTEWEKDFDQRILSADSETLIRVTNFAEQNGMVGLLDFCVVALSCAVRGKSNHEMMVALCVDGEEMTPEEIEAGKQAYPWVQDITAVHEE